MSPTKWFNISLGSMSIKLFWGGNTNIILGFVLFFILKWGQSQALTLLSLVLTDCYISMLILQHKLELSSQHSNDGLRASFTFTFCTIWAKMKTLDNYRMNARITQKQDWSVMLQMLFSRCQIFFPLGLPISLCHPLLLPL